MKKIKVLQVIGGMNRGGAETFLMNVLRNINRDKFEFVFLCFEDLNYDYKKEVEELGAKIISISKPSKINFVKNVKEIINVIKNEKIDIVHAHTYYNSCYAILAAKICNVKVRITHSHNTKSDPHVNVIKKLYFKLSELIINKYSTFLYACGIDAGNAIFKRKFEVIENGINIEKFLYSEKLKIKIRQQLDIPENTVVLGHVGRFEEVKNHSFLLEIFNEYLKINPKSILVLIGKGILKDEILNKAKDMNIDNKIKYLGTRSDVNEIYNVMDLFVFPSLFEGLPVTLIETQANGLKSLISNNVSNEVEITKAINFMNLNEGAKMWAKQIDILIQGNYRIDTYNEMINSNYNMKKNIIKLENKYIELLNS